MVVVKIELWPFGSEDRKRELGRAFIWNTGKGSSTRGEYKFQLLKKGKEYVMNKNVWKEGEIKDFPRKRLLGYDLLYRALDSVLKDR